MSPQNCAVRSKYHLPLLRQKIEHLGDVKLVLVDPIASYLSGGAGKKDYRGSTVDVRSVLDPLVDMAAELNVAIMGVMHFNKKQRRIVANVAKLPELPRKP